MEELIKILEEIKEHQMQTVQLARSTTVYKLADKALNKALRIHDVVGRSESFYCTCSRGKGLDHDEEGMPYCIECQKPVQ